MEKSHSRLLGKLNLESTLSKAFLLMRLIDSEHQLYDNCHLDLPKLLTGNNKLVEVGWIMIVTVRGQAFTCPTTEREEIVDKIEFLDDDIFRFQFLFR